MKRLIFLLVLLPVVAFGQNELIDVKTFSSNIWGVWSVDCGPGSIDIKKDHIIMAVNSNQIFIRAKAKRREIEPNRYILYLDKVEDLGRGGMNLDWKNFSRIKPIAAMERIQNSSKILFVWYGFYNSSLNEYEWTNNADWSDKETGFFKKCHE